MTIGFQSIIFPNNVFDPFDREFETCISLSLSLLIGQTKKIRPKFFPLLWWSNGSTPWKQGSREKKGEDRERDTGDAR